MIQCFMMSDPWSRLLRAHPSDRNPVALFLITLNLVHTHMWVKNHYAVYVTIGVTVGEANNTV